MTVPQFRLNLSGGSISFNFNPDAAYELQATLATLMESLKVTSTQGTTGASKPAPQKTIEYLHKGDVFLEIFCNPNIWSSPFAAKVLITLKDDRIRLSTEAELVQLNEDLTQYLEQFR